MIPSSTSATDRAHLARALAVATAARGRCAPNPHVGCLLVAPDGRVVAEGVTTPPGGPHAEAVALEAAGDDARGATAFVTLEPCAHHGRTPPCADALVAAGVARVVVAHPDPHELAAGGLARLREAGVAVDLLPAGDPLRTAVAAELAGFLQVVTSGRPHVTLKLAQTFDGALHADGRWVTGPSARRAVHRLRAAVDAVLVGIGTVRADDPRLDVRAVGLAPGREQPRPVVLDTHLAVPPTATVVARGALVITTRPTVATPDGAARARALVAAGAEVVAVEADPVGRPQLAAALAAVADAGVTTVLAEPGPTLAGALLAAGLVDRLVLHVAAQRATPDAAYASPVAVPPGFTTRRLGGAGPDVVWERHAPPVPEPVEAA